MTHFMKVRLPMICIIPLLLASFAKADSLPKGVGPVQDLKLEAKLDEKMIATGKKVFEGNCTACHKMDERYVGPALKGVTQRRSPEWIMNMILNTSKMLEEDDTAKELLGEYMTQMASVTITKDQTRAILEYFRSIDAKK